MSKKAVKIDMFDLAKSMGAMAEIDTATKGDLSRITFDSDIQWVGMTEKEVKAYKAAFDLVNERDQIAVPAICIAMGKALLNAIEDDAGSVSGSIELYGERTLTVGLGATKENEVRAIGISLEEPGAIKTSVGRAVVALERMASGIFVSDDVNDESAETSAEEVAGE